MPIKVIQKTGFWERVKLPQVSIDPTSALVVGALVFVGWSVATGDRPLVGSAPATAKSQPSRVDVATAEKVVAAARATVGKTTAQAGSWVEPRVSCAAVTSRVLQRAGLSIPPSAAVTTSGGLVANLRSAGWIYTPKSQVVPGCIVFNDDNGNAGHGPEHIGVVSTPGGDFAYNTRGGMYTRDNYPQRKARSINRNNPEFGGYYCPPTK